MQSRLRHSGGFMNRIGASAAAFSWEQYWASHLYQTGLDFWVKEGTRNGLELPDSLGGTSANILPPCYMSVARDENLKFATTKNLGTVYSIYWRGRLDNSAYNHFLNNSTTDSGIWFSITDRKWYHKPGGTSIVSANNALPAGIFTDNIFHDFCIVRNGTSVDFYVDGVAAGATLILGSNTDFTILNMWQQPTYGIKYITECKIYSTVQTPAVAKTSTPDAHWIIFTGFVNTDVITGEVLTFDNEVLFDNCYYSNEGSQYLLDNGYSRYKRSAGFEGLPDTYVPFKTDGNISDPGQLTAVSHYEWVADYAGSSTNHNLADSYINIPHANFDRSDVVLWNDKSRVVRDNTGASWYDAGNPDSWHIKELNQLTFISWGTSGHKSTSFVKVLNNSTDDRLLLEEIISYTTNLSTANTLKVVQYTGDTGVYSIWITFGEVMDFGEWASVLVVSGTYHAYYVYGAFPNYTIGHATSADGITWVEDVVNNPVLSGAGGAEWDGDWVYVPQVWKEGATWYMLYGGGLDPASKEQIGLATSADGLSWSRDGSNPVYAHGAGGSWDDDTVHKDVQGVIKIGGTYYMFITTGTHPRKVGVAWSTDLINWTRDPVNPIFYTVGESYYCPCIFKYGSLYYMVITHRVGTTDTFELYSCVNPTFHADERTHIATVMTEATTGLASLDTPFVLTDDINRDSFPANELWTYYSSVAVDNINLSIMEDVEQALGL